MFSKLERSFYIMRMHDLPLNALRALAAIRRSGGIRAAARDLHISPSAVHRHVRQLEAAVGCLLVEPKSTPLKFTANGERLSKAALVHLDRLSSSFAASSRASRFDRVIIRCTQSFATEWLMPRLPGFHSHHPDIEIWLETGNRIDLADDGAAISIRTGSEATAGAGATPLLEERLVPVAAPTLWKRPLEAADEIASFSLIHDFDAGTNWLAFARHHGIDAKLFAAGMRFGATSLTLQAAELGLGVALAPAALAASRVQEGNLTALNDLGFDIGVAYWIATRSELRANERSVREWLLSKASS